MAAQPEIPVAIDKGPAAMRLWVTMDLPLEAGHLSAKPGEHQSMRACPVGVRVEAVMGRNVALVVCVLVVAALVPPVVGASFGLATAAAGFVSPQSAFGFVGGFVGYAGFTC